MMLQKRLIEMVPEAKKHIAANVFLQWLSLLANIALTACVCVFLAGLVTGCSTSRCSHGFVLLCHGRHSLFMYARRLVAGLFILPPCKTHAARSHLSKAAAPWPFLCPKHGDQ